MYNYFIYHLVVIHLFNKIVSSESIDVCKSFYQNTLDDNLIQKNTIPSRTNDYYLDNPTRTLSECIHKCCSSETCNLAYFVVASQKCYLITCKTHDQCNRVEHRETNVFAINSIASYLLYIRPVSPIKQIHTSQEMISTEMFTTKVTLNTTISSIKKHKSHESVFVDAGQDQHITYPQHTCILNASNSKTYDDSQIIKYKWEKTELSPAFGNFILINGVSTSENKIAYVENLIKGTYTFSLKIWTNKSGEQYYQDTLQVIVNFNSSLDTNALVRLTISKNPLEFNEIDEYLLVTQIQSALVRPPSIKNPSVHLTNKHFDIDNTYLILEFYVTNDVKTQIIKEKNELIDSTRSIVIDSDVVFEILRKFFYSKDKDESLSLFNFNKHNLKQLKCHNNCSRHGTCDKHTYNCVCDQYWMSNLYKYYFLVEYDLTNGNNCEWNVFLVIFVSFLVLLVLFGSFYLCFCCCSCFCVNILCATCVQKCCKKQHKVYESRSKKSPVTSKMSLLKRITRTKSPTESKYTLLGNMEDESFEFKELGTKKKQERTYGLISTDEDINVKLNDDSDEDILYDTSIKSNHSNTSSKRLVPSNINEKLV